MFDSSCLNKKSKCKTPHGFYGAGFRFSGCRFDGCMRLEPIRTAPAGVVGAVFVRQPQQGGGVGIDGGSRAVGDGSQIHSCPFQKAA